MENVLSWLTSHWVVILPVLVLIVNSLINGLTDYPKTESFLRAISDLLAWTAHRNSHDTYKLPFTRSKPTAHAHAYKFKRPSVRLKMLLIFMLVAPYLPSCSWFSTSSKDTMKDVLDCSIQAARDKWTRILPIVMDILSVGSSWETEIQILAVDYGNDVINCAVQAALAEFNAKMTAPEAKMSPETYKKLSTGSQNAETYLKLKAK